MILYIIGIALFFISYEALLWGWVLNRHASWLKNNPDIDRRKIVSYKVVRFTSILSSCLNIFIWAWWMYIVMHEGPPVHPIEFTYVFSFIVFCVQLCSIHSSAFFARYSCLPSSMWPILTRFISILPDVFFNVPPPAETSSDVYRCWVRLARIRERKKNRKKEEKNENPN